MARKRLLTILAAAVAAIGLQVAPATALDAEQELFGVKVGASISEDGVEVEVDEDGDDQDGQDDEDGDDGDDGDDDGVKAGVSEDGAEAEVGDQKISTEDVEEAAPGEVDDEPADADPVDSSDDDSSDRDSSDRDTSDEGSGGYEITAAGSPRDHERPAPMDPERARQFLPGSEGRTDLSRGAISSSFDLSSDDGMDDPLVAAPSEQPDGPGASGWESADPADSERSDAELAAIPGGGSHGDAVPAGLKLLAGLLVAGTGTLWHLSRRELDAPRPVRAG